MTKNVFVISTEIFRNSCGAKSVSAEVEKSVREVHTILEQGGIKGHRAQESHLGAGLC